MSDVVPCPKCASKNRLGAVPAGAVPRCANCKTVLPWLVAAGDESFTAEVAAGVPVLVDFWAPWCGPCRMVAPILEELAGELAGRLKVVKVNVDESPQVAARYRIQSIPTLMVFREGAQVEVVVGALPKAALRERIAPYLSSVRL